MTSPFRRALLVAPAAFLTWGIFLVLYGGGDRTTLPGIPHDNVITVEPSEAFHVRSQIPGRDQANVRATPGPLSLIRDPAQTPEWAIRYGEEFWRPHLARTGTSVSCRGAATALSPIQLGDAIDRVTHAFECSSPETAQAEARSFRANVDASGLTLAARGPVNPESTPVRFRTRRISV